MTTTTTDHTTETNVHLPIVQVPRASQVREACEQAGLEGAALELFIAAGAPARHRARVLATIRAAIVAANAAAAAGGRLAEAWVAATTTGTPAEGGAARILAVAWALVALDVGGVGGRHCVEGAASARMGWARGLGKGRWHASDGDAWRAAAEGARARLEGAVPGVALVPPEERHYDAHIAVRFGAAPAVAVYGEAAWAAAHIGRLLVAAGEAGDPGAVATWGAAYNTARMEVTSESVHQEAVALWEGATPEERADARRSLVLWQDDSESGPEALRGLALVGLLAIGLPVHPIDPNGEWAPWAYRRGEDWGALMARARREVGL